MKLEKTLRLSAFAVPYFLIRCEIGAVLIPSADALRELPLLKFEI
jgi:hypothetical protein